MYVHICTTEKCIPEDILYVLMDAKEFEVSLVIWQIWLQY